MRHLEKKVEAERKKKRKTITIPADFGGSDAVFPRVGESYEFRLNEAQQILALINNHHREHATKVTDTVKRVKLDYSLRDEGKKMLRGVELLRVSPSHGIGVKATR